MSNDVPIPGGPGRAVRAGRLVVEIMTWYRRPGTMIRPGRAVTLPD